MVLLIKQSVCVMFLAMVGVGCASGNRAALSEDPRSLAQASGDSVRVRSDNLSARIPNGKIRRAASQLGKRLPSFVVIEITGEDDETRAVRSYDRTALRRLVEALKESSRERSVAVEPGSELEASATMSFYDKRSKDSTFQLNFDLADLRDRWGIDVDAAVRRIVGATRR